MARRDVPKGIRLVLGAMRTKRRKEKKSFSSAGVAGREKRQRAMEKKDGHLCHRCSD